MNKKHRPKGGVFYSVGAGGKATVVCLECLRASFSPFPGLNFGVVTSAIWIFSVRFRGLTPIRALRIFGIKAPNPAMLTSPPFWSVVVTIATNDPIRSSACFFVMPVFSDRRRRSSALFIETMLKSEVSPSYYFGWKWAKVSSHRRRIISRIRSRAFHE